MRNISLVILVTLLSHSDANAQTLWNWLHGRSPYVTPQYATPQYLAPQAVAPAVTGTTAPPTVAPATAVPTYAAPVAGFGSYGQRGFVGSPPVSPYRSTWGRISVTRYQQPTIVNQPVSGVPVVTYRPCTTSEYQVRRVPDYLGRVTSYFTPQQVMSPMSIGAPVAVPCPPTNVKSKAGDPYYPPATTSPNPVTTDPAQPGLDRRPSLDPSEVAPQGEARRSSSVPSTVAASAETPTTPIRPPAQVTPIPDPTRGSPVPHPLDDVPPLLDPDDNTANANTLRNVVVPTSWAAPLQRKRRATTSIPTDKVWDDSGWRSAK